MSTRFPGSLFFAGVSVFLTLTMGMNSCQRSAGVDSSMPEEIIGYRQIARAEACRTILELSDPQTRRRDYPEVSYAVIGSIVNGLMGVEPDAREKTVKTLSRLTEETEWEELDSLPVFESEIKVRHIGQGETVFTNISGKTLKWIARFYTGGDKLSVDGKAVRAERSFDLAGNPILRIEVIVGPNEMHSVIAE